MSGGSSTIYFRGNREQAKALARSLVGMLTGRAPDTLGIARGVYLTVGFAALGDIQRDFIRKSHGGPGEFSPAWATLKPATIAQRRIGPKDLKQPHIKARLDAEKAAIKAAREQFKEQTKARIAAIDALSPKLMARFSVSWGEDEARRRTNQVIAAKKALLKEQIKEEKKSANFKLRGKFAVTRATGETRQSVLAQREVDILRDTGVGLASLSQGKLVGKGPGASYEKPTSTAKTRLGQAKREGGGQQVFEAIGDGIVIGTSVPYMKDHQEGDPSRNLPARPFLPTDGVPPAWAERWAMAGLDAVRVGAAALFTQGA